MRIIIVENIKIVACEVYSDDSLSTWKSQTFDYDIGMFSNSTIGFEGRIRPPRRLTTSSRGLPLPYPGDPRTAHWCAGGIGTSDQMAPIPSQPPNAPLRPSTTAMCLHVPLGEGTGL